MFELLIWSIIKQKPTSMQPFFKSLLENLKSIFVMLRKMLDGNKELKEELKLSMIVFNLMLGRFFSFWDHYKQYKTLFLMLMLDWRLFPSTSNGLFCRSLNSNSGAENIKMDLDLSFPLSLSIQTTMQFGMRPLILKVSISTAHSRCSDF